MGKRIFIALPVEVYKNLHKAKDNIEKDIQKFAGRRIALTMPKFINALVQKNNEISWLLPFDKRQMYLLAKKKRGFYEP